MKCSLLNRQLFSPMIYLTAVCLLVGGSMPVAADEEIRIESAQALFSEGKYQEALAVLDKLIEKDPNNAEAYAWKGNTLGALAEQAKDMMQMAQYGMRAMQAFEMAVKLDPDNINGRLGRGISNLMAPPPFGNIDVALADLQKAVGLAPNHADAHYYLGVAYEKKNEIDRAKTAFERALQLQPDHTAAREQLAKLNINSPEATAAFPLQEQKSLAFIHVTVIDATGASAQPDMTVIIDGDRIAAIGKTGAVAIPENAQMIEAAGKFLIPGLWDMHVHIIGEPEWYFPLFIANGVTGIRYMGGSVSPEQWASIKKGIAGGKTLGPLVAAAGPIVDGPEPVWPGSIAVSDETEGREAVRSLKARGADFVKVYSLLPREAYFAIADEAKKQGIPFAGHTPIFISVAEASEAGQKSIEHLDGILAACSTREAELSERIRRDGVAALKAGETYLQLLDAYSEEKGAALFARLAQNETWQVPTMVVFRAMAQRHDTTFTSDPRVKYIPSMLREFFGWKPTEAADSASGFQRLLKQYFEIVRAMRQAEVKFMAGTDSPLAYCFPGFTLHDELALFVEAGLTPMEALQTATLRPAEYLGMADALGTVEAGKTANVVLLKANPLEDIRNTTKIAGVVVGGRFFSDAALQAMLDEVEAKVAQADSSNE